VTPDTARAALVFLQRSTLQGAEAPAFMRVLSELDALANSTTPLPSEDSSIGQTQSAAASD
jgi:hypothetical protein